MRMRTKIYNYNKPCINLILSITQNLSLSCFQHIDVDHGDKKLYKQDQPLVAHRITKWKNSDYVNMKFTKNIYNIQFIYAL